MAKSKLVTIRVGALMAAGIAILCFGIFSIGYTSRFLRHTHLIQAHFHRTNGLQAGAPVTLSGVTIGAVDSIQFPRDPRANYVVVTMWIDAAALPRVRGDSVAQISSMGLLGDKFVEITGGTLAAAPVRPDAVIAARDPIDYTSLLQKKGTSDLIANVMAISASMRTLLQEVEHGHGLLTALIKGEAQHPKQAQLTLDDVRKAFESLDRLTTQMDVMVSKINRGEGLAGAMLSDKTNGERILANIDRAAASMSITTQKVNQLVDRFNRAQGAVPRLIEDREYADRLLANMQQSSDDLRAILRKIDSGQGTVGLAVNDPTLYNEAKGAFAPSGSVGWGMRLMNGIYSLSHPFSGSSRAESNGTPPLTTSAPNIGGAAKSQPPPDPAAANNPLPPDHAPYAPSALPDGGGAH